MAGSINLSLSQQFDKLNGNLLSGGRLYFYTAGTDSPQDAFKDTGLTLVHPNPIILASDARIPQLYFADGSIHVRLTDSGGVVQFDEDFVLVIGPSSGGGGGGGSSVDPNAIFQTGDIQWRPTSGERSGWVIGNGNTIGNSSSGATYHTSDGQALFEYLYATYDNTICPVSSGRPPGETPLSAWSGGNKLTLLDFREITIGGLATMGGASDRGNFANIPHERGNQNTPAGIVGEIVHQLTAIDVPTHHHTGPTDGNNVDHTHDGGSLFDRVHTTFAGTSGSAISVVDSVDSGGSGVTGAESTPHTHTFTTSDFGGNQAHNVTSRTMLGTFYIKL